jgi:hypothetical protein
MSELEKRVTKLEQELELCPGQGCPRCGKRTLRVERSEPDPDSTWAAMGIRWHHVKCEECRFEEDRRISTTTKIQGHA